MNKLRFLSLPLLAFLLLASIMKPAQAGMDNIVVDGNGFAYYYFGPFTPWGMTYEPKSCSIINNLQSESGTWATGTSGGTQTQQDLQYVKSLGCNVVRIMIQFGDIMTINGSGNPVPITTTGSNGNGYTPLESLTRVCNYCATLGIYLDITFAAVGPDVPAAYAAATQTQRWIDQAAMWGQIANAAQNGDSNIAVTDPNVIFCYDLENEPTATTTTQTSWEGPGGWPVYMDENPGGLDGDQIAAAWASELTSSSATYKGIRYYDTKHMVTIGELGYDFVYSSYQGGFDPSLLSSYENFVSVHLYPGATDFTVADCVNNIAQYSVSGAPVLVEEWGNAFDDTVAQSSQFVEQASLANGGGAAGFLAWCFSPFANQTIAENVAALGTQPVPVGNAENMTITGATNTAPIVITTQSAHNLITGQQIMISNVAGNTAANGTYYIIVTGSTTFSLNFSDGTSSGTFTSGNGEHATLNYNAMNMWQLGQIIDPYDMGFEGAVQYYGTPATLTVSSEWAASPVVLETTTNNGFPQGQEITISGDLGLNGTFLTKPYPDWPILAYLYNLNGTATTLSTSGSGGTAQVKQMSTTPYYSYNPGGSPWAFTPLSLSPLKGSGVAANGSSFTTGDANAPQGSQVAFLQGTGIISQSFYFVKNTNYTISFEAAQRHTQPSGVNQSFYVTVGGYPIGGLFTPTANSSYSSYNTGQFTASSTGWYAVAFVGEATGDSTAFIDSVSIATP